jgi:hypothetical protein
MSLLGNVYQSASGKQPQTIADSPNRIVRKRKRKQAANEIVDSLPISMSLELERPKKKLRRANAQTKLMR